MSDAARDPAAPAPEPADPAPVGRRRFLDWLLAGSGLAWAASVLYPVLRFLEPPPSRESAGETTLDDAQLAKMDGAGFVIVRLGEDRVLVFRDRAGKLHANDAACTHEGCTVRYRSDEDLIFCACHNARFDNDGRVVSGPPPRPLPQFAVREARVGDAVRITVSRA